MNPQFEWSALSSFFSAVILSVIGVFAIRQRHVPGVASFGVLMFATGVWSLMLGLEQTSTEVYLVQIWSLAQFIISVCIPIASLTFVVQYTGSVRWSWRRDLAISIIPILSIILALLNPIHHLIWRQNIIQPYTLQLVHYYGPLFWLQTAYSFFLILVGLVFLIKEALHSTGLRSRQLWAITLAACPPLLSSSFDIFGVIPLIGIDPSGLAFTFSGLVISWALFRFRLLDLVPTARSKIVESIADGVLVIDRQGRVVDMNPAAEKILGVRASEQLGKLATDMLPQAWNVRENLQCSSARSVQVVLEEDSSKRYFELNCSPLMTSNTKSSNGAQQGNILLLHEVTERRRAELELQEQRDFALSIMNNMGQGLTITNASGLFEYVNPQYAQMLGRNPIELIGTSPLDFAISNSQTISVESFERRLRGETNSYEVALMRSDGELVYATITGVPLWREGQVRGSIAVITDLTERKKAEAELELSANILRSIRNLVLVADSSSQIRYVSSSCKAMLGYEPEELMGDGWWKLRGITDEAIQTEKDYISKCARGEIPVDETIYETQVRHKNGDLRWLVIKDSKGPGDLVIGIGYDNTERKQMEKALAETRDQALEASRLKSEFLATMSHEIRTPMNAVIGMSELLFDTELNETQHEFATLIHESAFALLNIINDILDFSKIEAGKLLLDQADFDLLAVVESAVQLFARQAQEKNLALLIFVSPDIPVLVNGDAGRLRQILINFIGNAIKFTAQGEISVRVTLDHAQDNTIVIRAQVRDTGIGMSEATCRKIFAPFTQADSSTTRRYGGTGLGLAICKRLVEIMGGEIGVTSIDGQGSTFWFTARLTATRECPEIDLPQLNEMRVLVVVPNSTQRDLVREYLQTCHALVETASSLDTALVALHTASKKYDVIFADIGDSHTLVAAVKQLSYKLDLVLFDKTMATDDQGIYHLGKPLKRAALFDLLTDLANHHPSTQVTDALDTTSTERGGASSQGKTRGTILIAEDNPLNQRVTRIQLLREGYTVELAENGKQAIEMFLCQPHRFCMILMDCMMPEVDGFEATRRIRLAESSLNTHVPIIALSANILPENKDHAFASGMDDYLVKPVKLNQLRLVLTRWSQPRTSNSKELATC